MQEELKSTFELDAAVEDDCAFQKPQLEANRHTPFNKRQQKKRKVPYVTKHFTLQLTVEHLK